MKRIHAAAPTLTSAMLLLASLFFGACYSVSYGTGGYERHGVWLPGPRASTYRPSRTIVVEDHEMHFDDELRVYRLVDPPGCFYSAGRFYRRTAGTWETARSLSGSWAEVPETQIPPTLAKLPADG